MYLKRLEIQGFKTFASRTVFEFRPGITAVVGPNGSGKSNIADAVRWVLGEQSLAALRCKRAEELIYSGGGRRAPAGLAEVHLTIDNSDRLLPIDFDEVTIGRRLTRGGDAEYTLNRARVRLRDLLAAVEPLGSSYTIINQGLVDAALTLRPEERRKLFEDAAEIGGFELRKAEALRRLRETDGNLQRVADLIAELEPRLRSLKRQAGQARQYRELSEQLHDLLRRSYAIQWRAAQARSQLSAAEATRSEQVLDQARAAQSAVSAELHELRTALRSRREDLSALHQRSAELHRRAEAAQRDLMVGAERLAALIRRAEDLERQSHELSARHAAAAEQHQAAAADLARAEAELDQTRTTLREAEASLAGMEQARQALAREVRQAQDNALRAAAAVAEQQSRIDQLQAQHTRLEREHGELDAARAQATQRLAGSEEQVHAAKQALDESEQGLKQAQEAERAARRAIEEIRRERAAAEEQRAAARRTLADAEARLDSLQRLARSYAGAFAGVRAAMQWADRQNRAGFALVQSVVRTPPELETAIETALGSRLQNIIVARWSDAEDAIAELKRSGAGRATFMPLDTIRGGGHAPIQTNHVVLGIAADLVDYDEQYEPAIRQLLGRVLVVRDLATARAELTKLSGGWTIVTLGGEQVNTGGAVTGGAPTKESGALRRERELRELPEQVAAARAELDAAEAQRNTLEQRNHELTREQRELERRAREAERELESRRAAHHAAERRAAQAAQEREWAEQRYERNGHDLAALSEQQQKATASHDSAVTQAAAAETTLAELRHRQESAAEQDRAAQERLAGLRAAVGSAEGQLRAQRNLLAAHTATLSQIERQQADAVAAQEKLATERTTLTETHDTLEAQHRALLTTIDALRAQIDPAEANLHEDEQHQAELEQREERATSALLEAEAAYNRNSLEAQRAADRQEALFERAAADGINLEEVDSGVQPLAISPQSSDGVQPSDAELQGAIEQLRAKILRLGAVNPLALEEYDEAAERHQFLSSQSEDLRQAGATLRELIDELDSAMSDRFLRTFQAVAAEFEQTFTQLFGGGSARLQLSGPAREESENGAEPNEHNLHNQGVEIIARPPGKKQQSISLLSGGERTLTAAALLFAILRVNPSPFCILDETDAALDESNVGRFGAAIQRLTTQTQFILITHNRGTIEVADTLYGVTMGDDGGSKTISLRVEEYVSKAAD